MSLEENKSIVRNFVRAYNNRNIDFDKFISPDYFDHTHKVDLDGLKQLFEMGFQAFPDWYETIEDIIAEGDKVWIRVSYTGTHTGEFMGLPPTGNKVNSEAVDIYRIADGKLAEYWNVTNDLKILEPLEAIKFTEKGKKAFPEDI